MGIPNPLPWPASAQVMPIRKHKHMRSVQLRDFGELRIVQWDDGEEVITLRVFCDREHCRDCGCNETDHVHTLRPYEARAILAAVNDLSD